MEVAHDMQDLTIDAESSLLRRLLENLMENATRHAAEETEVRWIGTRTSSGIELRVLDRGPGVAPEARTLIFEPFVQLDHGDRVAPRTGRGLGLTFCEVAGEAHAGRIWVADSEPGAAFCLSLPDAE